jgi:multidrug efflux pump subunit AcrA (membrane-fusion protein)
MSLKKILVSAVAFVILVAGGLLAYQRFAAPLPATPTPTPAETEPAPISAEGRIVPAREATLAFRYGGRVNAIRLAEGETVEAGEVLIELETADLRANVAQAQAALDAARAQQALAPEGALQEQKDFLAAQVSQAQAALEAAQTALDEAALRAPFAGTIVAVAAEVGEVVAPGAPVVVLADLSEWRVETLDMQEKDAVRLRRGQHVRVKVAALPGETLAGVVERIALSASAYQGNVTYAVRVRLEETTAPLSWGMTAFVEIDVNAPLAVVAEPTRSPTPKPTATRVSPATATDQPRPANATPTAQASPLATVSTRAGSPVAATQLSERPASVTVTATPVVHIVTRGENLFRIALRYGTTIRAIMQANGLKSTTIYTGQRLIIR